MNKYYADGYSYYNGGNNIDAMLMPDESIIWRGTPKKNAFIINSATKMMPFALMWLLFDGFFIAAFLSFGGIGLMPGMGLFLVFFFALHLMPVWIWLYNVVTAVGRWKNTEYAVTDKRIILRNGLVGYEYQSLYYTEIGNVSLHVGFIDQMLGVGDINIAMNVPIATGKNQLSPAILDIEDVQRVFSIIQRTVLDIQTDMQYPNAMRPDINPGYKTAYRPEDSNNL